MVMLPLSRPAPARLIVVGKKHLPERGQRFWALVVAVANTVSLSDLFAGGATWQRTKRVWPRLHVVLSGDWQAQPLPKPRQSCTILDNEGH